MLNKGNTGTIFITPLVWRGPWLRIEPGRSQHSTTKLSRRRCIVEICVQLFTYNTNPTHYQQHQHQSYQFQPKSVQKRHLHLHILHLTSSTLRTINARPTTTSIYKLFPDNNIFWTYNNIYNSNYYYYQYLYYNYFCF